MARPVINMGLSYLSWEPFLYLAIAFTILGIGIFSIYQKSALPTPVEAGEDLRRAQETVQRRPRRDVPLNLIPICELRDIVREEELGPVVASVQPSWPGPSIGLIIHSLRLWGAHAAFAQKNTLYPDQNGLITYPTPLPLEVLLDHNVFRNVFQFHTLIPPLLTEGRMGVAVTTKNDPTWNAYQGQFHADDILQVLGEIGIPRSYPVRPKTSSNRRFTVDDLINESLWSYSQMQEPDFTAGAYARWLRGPATWRNRFNELCSLDLLADQLVKRPFGRGACLGTHLPYAMVSLLRAHEVEPLISDNTAARLTVRLRELSTVLTRNQQADGSWPGRWCDTVPDDREWRSFYLNAPLNAAILTTGHHLEWIALALAEVRPPREVIVRAARFLLRTIPALPKPFFADMNMYPAGTHAVRALCLLCGVDPWEVYQRFSHSSPNLGNNRPASWYEAPKNLGPESP